MTTKTLKLKVDAGIKINWQISFIFLVIAVWVGLWLFRLINNITMPQIEYSEGLMLYNATAFGSGTWSWNLAQPDGSYHVTYYTPLYYWIAGGLMNVFGYQIIVGRILILVCFFIACLMVYLIVNHVTKNKLIALIGGLLPLCFSFTSVWSWFNRVDIMAVMFELAGVYIAFRFWKSRLFYGCIALFFLAFLTKQSSLAGFAAVFIALLIRNWKDAMFYASICLVIMVYSINIGNHLTDGQFLNHIFFYQRTNPAFREDFWALIFVGYLELIPLLLLSYQYIRRNLTNVISIFAMVAVVVSLGTIVRPGGAANYFFEAIFALIITSACALPLVFKSKRMLTAVFIVPVLYLFIQTQLINTMPDATYRDRVKEAQNLISDAAYPIVTDNFGLVIGAGKVPYYEPFVFSNLSHFGYWDGNILLDDLKSQRIEYVITQYPVGSDKVRRIDHVSELAIMENYHVILDYSKGNVCPPYNPTFIVYEANNRTK